ncbi:MAG: methyltransferase domain-containing protein, partial [Salinisphaera sp.]|nr:methyltransferase domain-containing protein [Salinisphaera sp.]
MTSPLSELAQATAHRARVARYYRRTQWQYYGLWSGRKTLALHYGYWDTGVRSHPQALLRLNQVLAERVGIRAGDRVLDAGCGWGGSSIWLAREKAAACTGVTLERHQARIGANMARRRGVRADFARADFTALPFEDASFDVVWAVESVCHAPD